MSVTIKGEFSVVAVGCTSAELGLEAGRQLLQVVVEPMRRKAPKDEMELLCVGLLAGVVGHFGGVLSIAEIHEQLDRCKSMVLEVPGFAAQAATAPAAKGVH